LADAVGLEDLQACSTEQRTQQLKSVDALLMDCAAVQLNDELAARFLHGQKLSLQKEGVAFSEPLSPQHNSNHNRLRVYRLSDGKLLGTGLLHINQVLAPERLVTSVSGHFK
jgi:tRNA pseudouridine55 synthase